jgi:hypothetical protein
MFGKCWVCEEIAGVEAMHLVPRVLLDKWGECAWHARKRIEQEQRVAEQAKEKANVTSVHPC